MRATTVRFSEDLWRLLEREAEREGVSAAQFIRDASVMRAAYAMGRRGEAAYEALAQLGTNGHTNGGGTEKGTTPLGADEARRLAAESERRRAELLEEAARREALLATATAVQDPERLAALRKHRPARLRARPQLRPPRPARRRGPQRPDRARLADRRGPPVPQELRSASRSRRRASARRRSPTRSASTPSRSASR